ncbi:MAG: CoA transferase, partial [Mycobacteriaceae bacterium]|nr:CoA transferase [Mycobacteriaceae bacterium]
QHNPARPRAVTDLLVVDMSSMWAGPLSGRLLAAAGATVVKVETAARPDGTRGGDRRFYDWLNAGKLSFSTSFDSDELPRLLRTADVVIEGSRPAALARRGLSAEHLPARPGRVWVSISGYGRDHPDRVAFGDDAAVAGGLVIPGADGPVFCGDAIADPLTGLAATAAVVDALAAGGGVIIDVSMAAIAAAYAKSTGGEVEYCQARVPDLPAHRAHALGADNSRVRDLIEARAVAC